MSKDLYLEGVTCRRCGGPVLEDPEQHLKGLDGLYACGECIPFIIDGEDGEDDDPQCVCGVYRSEHALLGCPEGFQTAREWNRERDFIQSLDDDEYEAIYHPGDYR